MHPLSRRLSPRARDKTQVNINQLILMQIGGRTKVLHDKNPHYVISCEMTDRGFTRGRLRGCGLVFGDAGMGLGLGVWDFIH